MVSLGTRGLSWSAMLRHCVHALPASASARAVPIQAAAMRRCPLAYANTLHREWTRGPLRNPVPGAACAIDRRDSDVGPCRAASQRQRAEPNRMSSGASRARAATSRPGFSAAAVNNARVRMFCSPAPNGLGQLVVLAGGLGCAVGGVGRRGGGRVRRIRLGQGRDEATPSSAPAFLVLANAMVLVRRLVRAI
jgi:hypothetical protein